MTSCLEPESRVHYAPLDDLQVAVFAEGGEATLVSLEAWRMAPAEIDHSRLWASVAAEAGGVRD